MEKNQNQNQIVINYNQSLGPIILCSSTTMTLLIKTREREFMNN